MEVDQGESTMGFRPWSNLPEDLLELISKKKLTDIFDYASFRCVCRSWRSATNPTNLSPQVPWLMLPFGPETPTRSFLCLTSKKIYTLDVPEIQGKVMLGSSHGWMVVLDVGESSAFLFNPLTRAQIHLPPTTHLLGELGLRVSRVGENIRIHREADDVNIDHGMYIRRAYLSSSPSSADCVVVSILYRTPKLAFSRLGDDEWTVLDTNLPCFIEAVSYHKQQLYIIDMKGNMAISGISPSSRPSLIPSLKLPITRPICRLHLEASSGQLLLVAISIYREMFFAFKHYFSVFKLDQLKWSKVEGNGENAFFFSTRHFSSIPVSNFGGGVADCIRFRFPCVNFVLDQSEFNTGPYICVKNGNTDYGILRFMIPYDGFAKGDYISARILSLWKKHFSQPEWFTPALN